MKRKIKIFLIVLFSLFYISTYAQVYTELLGAPVEADTTYLYYRTKIVDPVFPSAGTYYIYSYNVNTWLEKLFMGDVDYTSGGNTYYGSHTTDIEFVNNQAKSYFAGVYGYSSPSSGSARYSNILKNGVNVLQMTKRSTASYEILNVEISGTDTNLIYVSSSNNFLNSDAPVQPGKSYYLKSSDGGVNWKYLETGFTLVSLNKNNDTMLFGIKNNKLLLSTNDTSLSYTVVDSNYKWNNHLTKFYYSGDKKHIYTTAGSDSDNNLVMSEDNGYTWRGIIQSKDPIYIALDKDNPEDIYYAAGKEIYFSSEYGKKFTLYNSLSSNICGICKKNKSNILYVLTSTKRYKVTSSGYELLLSSTLDAEKEKGIDNFSLSQNYPNPFNPSTRIDYKTGKDGFVLLKVYNAIGAEVATLVSEIKRTGSYSVTFDGKNLPSGIYFCRLTAGGSTEIRKMCLIK